MSAPRQAPGSCRRMLPERDQRDRARGAGGARRRAARARLPRARPDRARRRDRLRRARVRRRAAGRLDRRPGRRAATGSSGATTTPASATRSARTPGSSSCSRRASGSGRRERDGDGASRSRRSRPTRRRFAFLGVRSCELHAIAIQDRVFLGGRYADRDYAARREGAFIVAVNCFEPGGTCFCVSMGTGPKADGRLRPRADRDPRRRATASSSRSAASAARRCSPSCRAAPATASRPRGRRRRRRAARAHEMGRQLDTDDIRDLLARNLEHPRWDEVAERCLTCGNCTMVCPTCFCTTVEDVDRPRPASSAERVARLGLVLLGRLLATSTAAAIRPSRPLALPPVAHAQVRHLARPVRHLGLRRLRPLHHLVPGRHRHHRGAGRDPRDRGRRPMETH